MRLIKVFLIMFFIAGGLMASSNEFYMKTSTPFLDKVGGEQIGVITVLAKVKEIKKDGDYSFVEYVGFMPEGSANIYSQFGVIIQDFLIEDESKIEIIEEKADDYETIWQTVKLKGYVKTDMLDTDHDSFMKKGEELFSGMCGTCHSLNSYDEYDKNSWPSVIAGMKDQISIEDNDYIIMTKFVQSKAPIE